MEKMPELNAALLRGFSGNDATINPPVPPALSEWKMRVRPNPHRIPWLEGGDYILVGFRGLAGAGKTSVAKYVADTMSAYLYSFAGPIREALRVAGVRKETHLPLYRFLAQQIGATCRAHDPDHWIKQLAPSVQDEFHHTGGPPSIVVVDDVRYPNEAQMLDLCIYVEGRPAPPSPLGGIEGHESEAWNAQGADPAWDDLHLVNEYNQDSLQAALTAVSVLVGLLQAVPNEMRKPRA